MTAYSKPRRPSSCTVFLVFWKPMTYPYDKEVCLIVLNVHLQCKY